MLVNLKLYLLGLGLLPGGTAAAQRLAPGYVIMISGDSIRGAIRLSSPFEQQLEVKFVPLTAERLVKLQPAQLRAYGYVQGHDTVRYAACPVQLGYPVQHRIGGLANDTTWILLKQLMAGPVQLYERYTASSGGRGNQSIRQYLLRKGKAVPINTYWWNFPKDAAAFFHDHPVLTTRLQARYYHARDLKTVVQLYNHWQLAATKAVGP